MSEENKIMSAEEAEERDLVEFSDEDGNKVMLEVIHNFFYNGEEYVALCEPGEEGFCDCEECEHEHEDEEEGVGIYLMKVVPYEEDGEEMEEFVPVEDEALLEELIKIVEADFANDEAFDD